MGQDFFSHKGTLANFYHFILSIGGFGGLSLLESHPSQEDPRFRILKTELLTPLSAEESWETGTLRQKTPKANKTDPISPIFKLS